MGIHYMAYDPGHTTGWAAFSKAGKAIGEGVVVGKKELYEHIDLYKPKLVICEEYRLFPWKSQEQAMSLLNTVRIIGAIEFWCYMKGVPLKMQEPSIKTVGYMWANRKKKSSHALTHADDAFVHGVHYLVKQGLRLPKQAD